MVCYKWCGPESAVGGWKRFGIRDLKSLVGTVGMRQEYTLHGIPIHHSANLLVQDVQFPMDLLGNFEKNNQATYCTSQTKNVKKILFAWSFSLNLVMWTYQGYFRENNILWVVQGVALKPHRLQSLGFIPDFGLQFGMFSLWFSGFLPNSNNVSVGGLSMLICLERCECIGIPFRMNSPTFY